MTIEQRRIVYTIPANEVDSFVENIQQQFGKVPDDIRNPLPFPNRLIFISYRRDDSADITGRIYDNLAAYFGKDSIFKDTEDIPFGVDFRTKLEKAVSDCDVALVLIGKTWDNAKNQKRLNDPDDFVRFEIETALKRDIPVIPVLVQGRDKLPSEAILPPGLKQLVYRNGMKLRADPDFRNDMRLINETIERIFAALP